MSETHILVVEDDWMAALDIQRKLERLGYRVPITLASGEAAIAEAERTWLDLALIDVYLEGVVDGI